VAVLQSAASTGLGQFDAIAEAYSPEQPERAAVARRYLRENLVFGLTDRALEGLQTYYREAVAAGICPSIVEPQFFPG
jgi:hypothetical protein